MNRHLLPWICAMLLLLVGCGTASAPAPAATIAAAPLHAEWQQVELRGLSLALPPTWIAVDSADIDISAAASDLAGQNPQLQTALDQAKVALATGAVQFIAYDFDLERLDDASFPATLRIGRQRYPDAPDANVVADANEEQLRATEGFTDVQRLAVAIGDQPATRLTSTLQLNAADGEQQTLALEQYLLVRDTDVYVVTLTTTAAQQEDYRAIFDQIVGTLQLSDEG